MASLTRWTWVWVNSRRWWLTGRPGVLRFMGSQRVGYDWATDLIWSDKLKKVGNTTRPFRYDLNQIPYDYTVEVRNRFKGLDLIDKSAWWTMDRGLWHCTGDRNQDHPHGKEMQNNKMAVWGGLTNSCERRQVKVKSLSRVWTLCDPVDCSLPGSSIHGIFQARILKWVAISFSRRSSQPRD